jgi:hypothetical protein
VAVGACALGYACGQAVTRPRAPLAPAGSQRDDGRGVLARLSAGAALDRPDERAARPPAPTKRAAETPNRGSRAATYGGTRYGNYRFDRSPRPFAAPLPYAGRYVPVTPAQPGAIHGVVAWPEPPIAPDRLPAHATERSALCRGGAPNRSLSVGEGGAVANAVVYLEDVTTGRPVLGRLNALYPNLNKQMQMGGVLEWRDCAFHPSVQVTAPIGSVLTLISADEAIRVSATLVDGSARTALWSVLLGAPGTAHEHLLDRSGFLELRAQVGAQAASGWVVVAPNPYVAITDERGRFALDEVPPGAYTLVVWHQPVVVGVSRTGESATHTVPLVRRRVVIKPRQAQHVNIKLPPAR